MYKLLLNLYVDIDIVTMVHNGERIKYISYSLPYYYKFHLKREMINGGKKISLPLHLIGN